MARPFRLNRRGVGDILKRGGTAGAINQLAEQIQAAVQESVGDDIEVTVQPYVTDRGAAAVTIEDPRGLPLQARDGVLTRAAARLGLEVQSQ